MSEFDPLVRYVALRLKLEHKCQPELPPVRLDAKGLSVEELTGLPAALEALPVRQLMLPLSMCYSHPVSQGGTTSCNDGKGTTL
jgi:hypothetical protein